MSSQKTNHRTNDISEAVSAGDLPRVLDMIAGGAKIDAIDQDGRTPLFTAIVEGHEPIVADLVKHGADVNARDTRLETPLHFAAREYQVGAAAFLLEHGAKVDAQDCHGNTPLFRAVFESRGRGEMIELLLKYSANKHLKNNHGMSPLDLAKSIANFPVLRFVE